jgi:hypothetical protein
MSCYLFKEGLSLHLEANALVHYYEYVQFQSLLDEAKRIRARWESIRARKVHGNARSCKEGCLCLVVWPASIATRLRPS